MPIEGPSPKQRIRWLKKGTAQLPGADRYWKMRSGLIMISHSLRKTRCLPLSTLEHSELEISPEISTSKRKSTYCGSSIGRYRFRVRIWTNLNWTHHILTELLSSRWSFQTISRKPSRTFPVIARVFVCEGSVEHWLSQRCFHATTGFDSGHAELMFAGWLDPDDGRETKVPRGRFMVHHAYSTGCIGIHQLKGWCIILSNNSPCFAYVCGFCWSGVVTRKSQSSHLHSVWVFDCQQTYYSTPAESKAYPPVNKHCNRAVKSSFLVICMRR